MVHRVAVAPRAVLLELLPMVGGHHDNGVVVEPELAELHEELPEVLVVVADLPVVQCLDALFVAGGELILLRVLLRLIEHQMRASVLHLAVVRLGIVHLQELVGRVVRHVGVDRLDVDEEPAVLVLLDPILCLAEHVGSVGVAPLTDVVGVVVPTLIKAERI